VPLTGTTSRKHMEDDLDVAKFSLDARAEAVGKLFSLMPASMERKGSSARAPNARV